MKNSVDRIEELLNMAFEELKNLRSRIDITEVTQTESTQSKRIHLAKTIITRISHDYQIPVRDLLGKVRTEHYCYARFLIMLLIYELTHITQGRIGELLGDRGPDTISHGITMARWLRVHNFQFCSEVTHYIALFSPVKVTPVASADSSVTGKK